MAIFHADRIQRTPNDVVANSRKVFYTATADQHNRVLLKIMSDPWNIGGDLNSIGQTHTSHFAKRRIGLLGCLCVYTNADSSFLRTPLQRRTLRLGLDPPSSFSN